MEWPNIFITSYTSTLATLLSQIIESAIKLGYDSVCVAPSMFIKPDIAEKIPWWQLLTEAFAEVLCMQ